MEWGLNLRLTIWSENIFLPRFLRLFVLFSSFYVFTGSVCVFFVVHSFLSGVSSIQWKQKWKNWNELCDIFNSTKKSIQITSETNEYQTFGLRFVQCYYFARNQCFQTNEYYVIHISYDTSSDRFALILNTWHFNCTLYWQRCACVICSRARKCDMCI